MSNKVFGYKARHKETGLYLKKGSYGFDNKSAWNGTGGTWNKLSHLISSLKLKLEPEEYHKVTCLEIVELVEGKSYSSAYILDRFTK